MRIETILMLLDLGAGIVLLAHSFCAVFHMGPFTQHAVRLIYIGLAVSALGMLLSPTMDAEWRRYAHVAVIASWVLLIIFDQRKRPVMSLGG